MDVIRRWDRFYDRHSYQAFLIFCFFSVAIVWGSTKSPSVTRKGIKWKSVNVTPRGITAEWEAEDGRIADGAEYIIEYRKKWLMLGDTVVEKPEDMQWKEFGRTKDKQFAKECWFLDSTYDIRVRTVVQEGVTK